MSRWSSASHGRGIAEHSALAHYVPTDAGRALVEAGQR